MYIVKYMYFEHKPGTMEDNTFKMHDEQITADTLKGVMQRFNAAGLNHDLVKYSSRHIYDVINTEE